MFYNASADLWYQYFSADNNSRILTAVYGIRALWALVGLIFNFGMVYMTAKNKSLRSICNILLAMESCFAIILDVNYFFSFLVMASGFKFVRYEYCFWALMIPCCLVGDAAQLTMVCTGFDRLLCALFPIWYKQRNAKRYFALIGTLLCCYAIYDFIVNYIDYLGSKDALLSCTTNELGQGDNVVILMLMQIQGLTLSGTLMVVYSLCWFTVFKLSATSKTVSDNNRKVIKSLIFIIGLNMIGVFVKCGANMMFQNGYIAVTVFNKTWFSIVFSFLTIAVYSANAPVLYVISKEYRTRFNDTFRWLPKLLSRTDEPNVGQNIIASTTAATSVIIRPWAAPEGHRFA